jgi:hypothetical protein
VLSSEITILPDDFRVIFLEKYDVFDRGAKYLNGKIPI